MTISATTQGLKPGVVTSSNRPANPYDGMVIYMTDVDQTAVWDGTSWVGLDPSRDRNVIINGAMQIAQRGTSTASITTNGFYTADRFNLNTTSLGTWTQSVEADAPTGSGFRNSLKMLCTTADASPSAGDVMVMFQRFEGKNVQQFLKGTASAKPFAVSFWVKSNVTGTYIAELQDTDNTRQVSASYTISASATWEKKTIIYPADTTGALDNNNESSLQVNFWMGAGSDRTSGTLQTTWAATVNANRVVGQTNLAAATSNYWQITGVQLEAGSVATPFEFEDFGTTLAKCQRYYEKTYNIGTNPATATQLGMVGNDITASANHSNYIIARFPYKVTKRTAPTITTYDASGNAGKAMAFNVGAAGTDNFTVTADFVGEHSFRAYLLGISSAGFTIHYTASAEL